VKFWPAFPTLIGLQLENSPWTACPYNWYILTSLTESLYLEGSRSRFGAAKHALAVFRSRFLDTILSGNAIAFANKSFV
jgi:hypothetical protein